MKIPLSKPLADPDEDAARNAIVLALESDPEYYLAEYSRLFGNVLNADSAATLFAQYNADPAKYRVAVHPAAQWIRDELFRRALKSRERNRIVFTAGGNAAGKSTALTFSGANDHETAAILDSTFSNYEHARHLVTQALEAGKVVTVLYVNRPLDDALLAMLDRARVESRVVTLDQLINSQRGAATTVRMLWQEFARNNDLTFRFLTNTVRGTVEGGIDMACEAAYTVTRYALDRILDAEYRGGHIAQAIYQRISGRSEPPIRGY